VNFQPEIVMQMAGGVFLDHESPAAALSAGLGNRSLRLTGDREIPFTAVLAKLWTCARR